jgi:hypothetical protein
MHNSGKGSLGSSPQALTLWTVSLGVDNSSSSSKHSTAGPWDRSSHLLGEMVGEEVASAQAGTSWGDPLFAGKTGKSQPQGQDTLTPNTLLNGAQDPLLSNGKQCYWHL